MEVIFCSGLGERSGIVLLNRSAIATEELLKGLLLVGGKADAAPAGGRKHWLTRRKMVKGKRSRCYPKGAKISPEKGNRNKSYLYF